MTPLSVSITQSVACGSCLPDCQKRPGDTAHLPLQGTNRQSPYFIMLYGVGGLYLYGIPNRKINQIHHQEAHAYYRRHAPGYPQRSNTYTQDGNTYRNSGISHQTGVALIWTSQEKAKYYRLFYQFVPIVSTVYTSSYKWFRVYYRPGGRGEGESTADAVASPELIEPKLIILLACSSYKIANRALAYNITRSPFLALAKNG